VNHLIVLCTPGLNRKCWNKLARDMSAHFAELLQRRKKVFYNIDPRKKKRPSGQGQMLQFYPFVFKLDERVIEFIQYLFGLNLLTLAPML